MKSLLSSSTAMSYVSAHPQLAFAIAVTSFLVLMLLIYILFPHRGRWAALKDKGYAKNGSNFVMTLKLYKTVIFFAYDRAKVRRDFEKDLMWFSQKFGEDFVAVKEVKWPHLFLLSSWMILKPLSFEKHVYVKISEDPDIVNYGKSALKKTKSISLPLLGEVYVTGASGSGKSWFVQLLIRHFQRFKFQYHVASSKPFDFESCIDTSISLDELESTLLSIIAETNVRKIAMIEKKVSHAKELKFKPILLVIDECHLILGQTKDPQRMRIIGLVDRLIRTGRAYFIITCLVSQKAQKNELAVPMREGIVISGRQDSTMISNELFDSEIATSRFLKRGVMIVRDEDGVEIFKGAK